MVNLHALRRTWLLTPHCTPYMTLNNKYYYSYYYSDVYRSADYIVRNTMGGNSTSIGMESYTQKLHVPLSLSHLRAEERILLEPSIEEVAVFSGGDETESLDADTAWPPRDLTRQVDSLALLIVVTATDLGEGTKRGEP